MQILKGNSLFVSVFRKSTLFITCLILFCGCNSKTFDNEAMLIDYITNIENGYTHHKSVNGYEFTLMYRPTDLLVNQELNESTEVSQKQIKELRDRYCDYIYFNLSISKDGQELLSSVPKDEKEFGGMVNLLAFGMNEKVNLYTQSKDTLELLDFIYPRTFGMSRHTTILFVYHRDKEKLKEKILNFTIEDLGLYTGEVKFKMDINKINNEPSLSFQN